MMHHPQLTSLHTLFKGETQPFRKVHRMIDLFESLIKMHTVVILVEYVHHNKLSDAAYALNRLFFADASEAEIAQLNRTLNIQWAIDIKNNGAA